MSEILSSGLTLTIPSAGDTNWATTIKTLCFQKISEHDHTGGGKGALITSSAIAADALNDTKIRLRNNQFLRARNAADSADINILKVNASNNLELAITIDGTSLSADSVNDEKVRLRNNQFLRARNAAGSSDVNILKVNASNALEFALTIDAASLTDGTIATAKIADSAISTIKIAADAVDDTKIRLRNNQYLRARNAANSSTINILRLNASDEVEVAYTGAIKLGIGGNATANIDIGSASDITCNVPTGEQFKITENGTTKVRYQNGSFLAPSGQTVALGDGTNVWTNIFGTGYVQMANSSAPSTPTGAGRIYVEAGALKYIGSSGTITTLGAA
jgi:hypothetical protein